MGLQAHPRKHFVQRKVAEGYTLPACLRRPWVLMSSRTKAGPFRKSARAEKAKKTRKISPFRRMYATTALDQCMTVVLFLARNCQGLRLLQTRKIPDSLGQPWTWCQIEWACRPPTAPCPAQLRGSRTGL